MLIELPSSYESTGPKDDVVGGRTIYDIEPGWQVDAFGQGWQIDFSDSMLGFSAETN